MNTPTPSSERDELRKLPEGRFEDEQTLIDKLGDICHEHYLGCAQNKTAPAGYEYSYDTEAIFMLGSPQAKAAIHHQTQIAQARYALAELEFLLAAGEQYQFMGRTVYAVNGEFVKHRISAIQAQQTRLDELSKGIGGDDGLV